MPQADAARFASGRTLASGLAFVRELGPHPWACVLTEREREAEGAAAGEGKAGPAALVATAAQRAHLHQLMHLLRDHRAQVLYPPHDVRGPLDAATFRLTEQQLEHVLHAGGKITADCSEAVTELCRWAGLSDPNGLGYRYAGYTGTLLAHLPHYTNPASAGVGALVVYGPGAGEHVSMVLETGRDPLVWSHGRGGVDVWRLSVQRSWHRPPVTFCSIAHL